MVLVFPSRSWVKSHESRLASLLARLPPHLLGSHVCVFYLFCLCRRSLRVVKKSPSIANFHVCHLRGVPPFGEKTKILPECTFERRQSRLLLAQLFQDFNFPSAWLSPSASPKKPEFKKTPELYDHNLGKRAKLVKCDTWSHFFYFFL